MDNEQIIENIISLMDLHTINDRGDYIDGVLDGLQMAIDVIKNSE